MVRDLEAVMVQLPISSLAVLPPNHDVRHLVRQILFIATESLERHRTPLSMSQKIVQLLYKTPSQLGREVYVALLDQLCHSFEDVAKEAITWLLYAEDDVSHAFLLSSSLLNNLFAAQVQRSCHSNFAAEWPREYLPSGSTDCEKLVHGASPDVTLFCGESYSRMSLQRTAGSISEPICILPRSSRSACAEWQSQR